MVKALRCGISKYAYRDARFASEIYQYLFIARISMAGIENAHGDKYMRQYSCFRWQFSEALIGGDTAVVHMIQNPMHGEILLKISIKHLNNGILHKSVNIIKAQ